eukprot:1161846-Pelagomonas_calceolata.AAC.4
MQREVAGWAPPQGSVAHNLPRARCTQQTRCNCCMRREASGRRTEAGNVHIARNAPITHDNTMHVLHAAKSNGRRVSSTQCTQCTPCTQ